MLVRLQMLLVLSVITALCSPASPVMAQNLKTGAAFDKASNDPVSQTLAGFPIRQALSDLSERYSVCIFLDRRVDPGTRLKQNPVNIPLKLVLYQIAENHNLGLVQFGSTWYIGPIESAVLLEHRHDAFKEKFQHLSDDAKNKWNNRSALQWDRLSVPSDLITRIISDNGLNGQGTDQVPFDLWPAQQLPGMSIADQVFLLLYGFDLKPRLTAADGSFAIEVNASIDSISLSTSRNIPTDRLDSIKDRYPNLSIKLSGGKRTFTGPPIDVYNAVWDTQIIKKPAIEEGSKSFFTLNTTAQRGAILKSAANQLGVQLEFDPALNEVLQERIQINVSGVTTDKLLSEVLEGSGCTYKLSKTQLTIVKK